MARPITYSPKSLKTRVPPTHYLTPPPKVSSENWLCKNVTMPAGTETGGMPFSLDAFPHVDGVLKAFDDPQIRIIVLQWGTRLGKTTTCLSLMSKQAGTNPRNMMFAGPTKDATGRVVASRLYPILDSTAGVKEQLLPEFRRSKLDVRLRACRIFIGWSGSETSLADVGAFFGVANEIDKWDQDASSEADSLALFLNRFKGFTNHKVILESTPTIKNRSRIEHWLSRSNRHRRYVPCPHCKHHQVLRKGDDGRPGGIKWDKDENGQSNPDIAHKTAYYECEKCKVRIENHHRKPMLRKGVWVPDGQTIDNEGKIHGTAIRDGSDIAGFGPLPSWYALTETWGSFARAWIRAQRRPRDLQDVINSYMAETWEPKKSKSTPESLGDRIGGTTSPKVVPEWGRFLTVTVDRQAAEEGFNPWVVLAHGDDDKVAEIHHGVSLKLSDVYQDVSRHAFKHADGGPMMTPLITGIDSGYATIDTYKFCLENVGCIPLKGSSTDLGGLPYKSVELDEKARSGCDGVTLIHVNTDYWETDLQCRLDERHANEPGSLTLSQGCGQDMEFMVQLCNAKLTEKLDARGNPKLIWIKKEEGLPNDWRDCIRYGICLGRMWIDSEGMPLRNVAPSNPVPTALQQQGFVRQPEQRSSGWIRRGRR